MTCCGALHLLRVVRCAVCAVVCWIWNCQLNRRPTPSNFTNSNCTSQPTPTTITPHTQGIYQECAQVLYEEIDYINEGRNADRFRRNFRDVDWVKVGV
jgi:hypothetical protein